MKMWITDQRVDISGNANTVAYVYIYIHLYIYIDITSIITRPWTAWRGLRPP